MKKKIAARLGKIKHVEVRHIGVGVIIFTTSSPMQVGGDMTPLAIQIENSLPDNWELEVGDRYTHYARPLRNMGKGIRF